MRLILGCGNFGGVGSAPAFFGHGESEEEAFALMDAAWALGITWFDTADAYGGGRSETWIGRWIADRGQLPGITTKVFNSVVGDPADRGLSRHRVLRQIDESLQRLGVDRVDTYMIHEPDPDTPIEETMTAMAELVQSGKVGKIGASNVDRAWLEEAREIAPVEVVQNSYSLLERGPEHEMLQLCRDDGIAFTAYGPLAGGWLSGKYRRDEPPPPGSRMTLRPEPYAHFDAHAVYAGLDRLTEIARQRDLEVSVLAYAWLYSAPSVAGVVLGPRQPEHLGRAAAALDVKLSEAERDELASLFP